MGLFFEVLSAINNPKQDASIQQLGEITQAVQQLGQDTGVEPDAMQSLLSNLGPMVGPLLKQQMGQPQAGGGGNRLGGLVSMVAGGEGGMSAVASMMTPQMMQMLGQQSGVGADTIKNLVPGLLPIVMKIMKMGSSSDGRSGGTGDNLILNAFLNGGSGGADLGTMLKFANRFMNPPQAH